MKARFPLPNHSRQPCLPCQEAPLETRQSGRSYRPRSNAPCRSITASLPSNTGTPVTPHRVPPSSTPPTGGMERAYKREIHLADQSLYEGIPSGTPPRLWARTDKLTDQRLYRCIPPMAHRRDSEHTVLLQATEGPPLERFIKYLVSRYVSLLTGLGGPARLYRTIGHIETRPFYKTPGALLHKDISFGRGKTSSRGHYVSIVTRPLDMTPGGDLARVHS